MFMPFHPATVGAEVRTFALTLTTAMSGLSTYGSTPQHKILFDSVVWDYYDYYRGTTKDIRINRSGRYLLLIKMDATSIYLSGDAPTGIVYTYLMKNGSILLSSSVKDHATSGGPYTFTVSFFTYQDLIEGDILEVWSRFPAGSTALPGIATTSKFQGIYLGALQPYNLGTAT